jgi:hypothetical protein
MVKPSPVVQAKRENTLFLYLKLAIKPKSPVSLLFNTEGVLRKGVLRELDLLS